MSVRFVGTTALQKYVGSLGGIGSSGVGSSSSYTPKEINKEVMPEKVNPVICFYFYYNIWQ
jgi:ATP-dependent metalloprotease